ncbi:Coq4 family protein [Polaribacter sp. Hel_I_88]|uniref:Coq4 family protein n=1 Tax=Polaribacter sp. Hel_I_88 TaxID=1250006 RepID=UPI00056326DE|nr:Coq4 family protein [Polaribacter sp. Hel_I_88]
MRKKFIYWLFEHSQRMYIKFKNKTPWGITSKELLTYSKDSFGYHLGKLLVDNNFELLPKVERHDCYHLLTNYGTKVEDEIALQYVCFGNGKRSPYLLGVLFIGTILLPEYYKYYLKSYKLGKNCNQFHHFNYKNILQFSLQDIRESIFNKQQILQIQ